MFIFCILSWYFDSIDKGVERKVILQNASAQDIENTLAQLVKSA
jgi:NADH dehydrogenase (ubiquinone) 1 alpha subcomplex subunit 2